MKAYLKILMLAILLASCDDDEINVTDSDPLTESLVLKGVKYGADTRQFLDLYKAESSCPTPVYFDAHGNGGTTAMPSTIIDDLNALGVTVIAWESLKSVGTPDEVNTGWEDAALMFQWVINNASTYNFDTSQFIIGGSSRGSILSWKYGHSGEAKIKGLYMYNALPSTSWAFPDWWYPPSDVTSISPPIYFVYKREPGSSTDPINPDTHDPNNGIIITDTYDSLGIGDKTTLVHSIGSTNNTDKYQFLVDFTLSLIDTCQ